MEKRTQNTNYLLYAPKKPNILVTGTHRSGTTWVGKMLALPKKHLYIHEPLPNQYIFPEDRYILIWQDFNFFTKENQNNILYYLKALTEFNVFTLRRDLINRCRNTQNPVRLIKVLKYHLSKINSSFTIFKDPFALFSSEWFYNELDAHVIIMVRHPAAFIGSLKVKSWEIDFNYFKQDVIDNYLSKYSDEIYKYSKSRPDLIDQGILFWNMIHSFIYQLSKKNKFIVLRHEDLSRNPCEEFKKLYELIGISFDEKTKERIIKHTMTNEKNMNIVKKSSSSLDVKRDSVNNISYWKERLSSEEIKHIKSCTSEVASFFYSEEDW